MTILDAVVDWAAAVRLEGLPPTTAASCQRSLTDSVGLIIAGSNQPFVGSLQPLIAAWGAGEQSSSPALGYRVPAASAAFINGCAAHCLDFDDTHLPSVLHPSSSVIPAALAMAEYHGRSGTQLRNAIAIGNELAVRLGMAGFDPAGSNSLFFDNGQHATSICGAIGAAAAAAALHTPDDPGAVGSAAGIATSLGAGILEANRTGGTVKRIHTGWAAHAGVSAAVMATYGVTSAPTAFEGRFGFFRAWCGDKADPDAVTDDLGQRWRIDDMHLKPYPCNHFTHTTADAAFLLRDRHHLAATDIASVTLGLPEPVLRTVAEPADVKAAPPTGYAAAFSAPYVFSAALCSETRAGLGLYLDDFTDAAAQRPDVRDLADRITCSADDQCSKIFPQAFPVTVTVTTHDGDVITERVHTQWGGPKRPLSEDDVLIKFAANIETAGLPPQDIDTQAALADLQLADNVQPAIRAIMQRKATVKTEIRS